MVPHRIAPSVRPHPPLSLNWSVEKDPSLAVTLNTHIGLVCDVSHDGGDDRHVHEGDARGSRGEAEEVVSGLLHSCAKALGHRQGNVAHHRFEVGRGRTHPHTSGRPGPAGTLRGGLSVLVRLICIHEDLLSSAILKE